MTAIDTARLMLRRWSERDVAPMAAINADPEALRWIGDGSTRTEQQTRASIDAFEHQWDTRGLPGSRFHAPQRHTVYPCEYLKCEIFLKV